MSRAAMITTKNMRSEKKEDSEKGKTKNKSRIEHLETSRSSGLAHYLRCYSMKTGFISKLFSSASDQTWDPAFVKSCVRND